MGAVLSEQAGGKLSLCSRLTAGEGAPVPPEGREGRKRGIVEAAGAGAPFAEAASLHLYLTDPPGWTYLSVSPSCPLSVQLRLLYKAHCDFS